MKKAVYILLVIVALFCCSCVSSRKVEVDEAADYTPNSAWKYSSQDSSFGKSLHATNGLVYYKFYGSLYQSNTPMGTVSSGTKKERNYDASGYLWVYPDNMVHFKIGVGSDVGVPLNGLSNTNPETGWSLRIKTDKTTFSCPLTLNGYATFSCLNVEDNYTITRLLSLGGNISVHIEKRVSYIPKTQSGSETVVDVEIDSTGFANSLHYFEQTNIRPYRFYAVGLVV